MRLPGGPTDTMVLNLDRVVGLITVQILHCRTSKVFFFYSFGQWVN